MGRFFNGGMEMMMVSVWVDGREGRGLKFFELTWTSVLWWGFFFLDQVGNVQGHLLYSGVVEGLNVP